MMNFLISILIMKTSGKDQNSITALFVTVSQSPDFLTEVALFRARQESCNS